MVTELQMGAREWIALGAAVVALAALMVSIRSSRIAGRAYSLAAAQEARRQPSLLLTLNRSELRRLEDAGFRFYLFEVLISNTSDSQASVREARMELQYGESGSPLSSLVAGHSEKVASRLTDLGGEVLHLPCALPARSSVAGILLFEVPSELLRQASVESCTVRVEDSVGHFAVIEAIFIQERRG